MKPEHKNALNKVLLILSVGIVAFVLWEIVKVFRAGERTLAGIALAPFTALATVGRAFKGMFAGIAAPAVTVTDADTAGINNPNTGQPITADNTLAGMLLGQTDPHVAGSTIIGWDNWLRAQQ